jgi:hypothetical protein
MAVVVLVAVIIHKNLFGEEMHKNYSSILNILPSQANQKKNNLKHKFASKFSGCPPRREILVVPTHT